MLIRDPEWRQVGSGIRDGKKSDPGSGINIPDPQHCILDLQKIHDNTGLNTFVQNSRTKTVLKLTHGRNKNYWTKIDYGT
jgi:hypothetical protein